MASPRKLTSESSVYRRETNTEYSHCQQSTTGSNRSPPPLLFEASASDFNLQHQCISSHERTLESSFIFSSDRTLRSSLFYTTPDNLYVNSFRFNQDGLCFAASTTEGFRVFTCSPLSEFARREIRGSRLGESINNYGRINIIAMLYRSHSFAFVTHKEPKKVQLWNDREGRVVGTIRCHHFVRNVLLGREVIAVVTENAVYLYLAGTVTPLHVLATGYNPQGLCALSSDANTPWTVACPAITPGAVRIQTSDTGDQAAGTPPLSQGGIVFQAHKNPIGCIALNPNGSMVATASILGTVIKIFGTSGSTSIYELRLASVPHEIRGISIRGDGQFVAVTSNSLKVHIFKLDEKALGGSGGPSAVDHGLDSMITSRNSIHPTVDSPSSSPSSLFHFSSPLLTPPASGLSSDWESHPRPTTQSSATLPGTGSTLSSSGFGASAFGSFTSAFVTQSRDLFAGTLKTVLPKYFAPTRSFAQLALPVDRELDVRSCSPAAIAQHRASPCEDCRNFFRQRDTSSVRFDLQHTGSITSARSSSGAARLVEGLGRSTTSFLSSSSRHCSQDDPLVTRRSICPCGFGTCWTSGPLCAFAGDRSNHLYVIHHDGFFYEGRFDSQYGGQCQILSVTPWFAPRRDFNLQASLSSVEVPPSTDTFFRRLSVSSSDEDIIRDRPPKLSLTDFNLSDMESTEQDPESSRLGRGWDSPQHDSLDDSSTGASTARKFITPQIPSNGIWRMNTETAAEDLELIATEEEWPQRQLRPESLRQEEQRDGLSMMESSSLLISDGFLNGGSNGSNPTEISESSIQGFSLDGTADSRFPEERLVDVSSTEVGDVKIISRPLDVESRSDRSINSETKVFTNHSSGQTFKTVSDRSTPISSTSSRNSQTEPQRAAAQLSSAENSSCNIRIVTSHTDKVVAELSLIDDVRHDDNIDNQANDVSISGRPNNQPGEMALSQDMLNNVAPFYSSKDTVSNGQYRKSSRKGTTPKGGEVQCPIDVPCLNDRSNIEDNDNQLTLASSSSDLSVICNDTISSLRNVIPATDYETKDPLKCVLFSIESLPDPRDKDISHCSENRSGKSPKTEYESSSPKSPSSVIRYQEMAPSPTESTKGKLKKEQKMNRGN